MIQSPVQGSPQMLAASTKVSSPLAQHKAEATTSIRWERCGSLLRPSVREGYFSSFKKRKYFKNHGILSMLKDSSKIYLQSFWVQKADGKKNQMGTEKHNSVVKETLISVT